MTIRWAACFVLLSAPVFGQQETPAKRHERAIEHLKGLAADLSARSLDDVTSLDEWKQRRPRLLREMLYMLGLDPLPERTPLHARITGTLDRPEYRVEKLVFQSRPGLYVTGNFYLPKKATPPMAAVLYVCGHAPHPLGAKIGYQDRGVWFAEHGTACLVLDTLEFGEVAGVHHGLHDLNTWTWQSRGYIPTGVEVWNAMRAVDYLESRPDIDRTRIGMTGISGGGSTTWFTAAVDDRIAAAAPICSTYTFGSQAAHWVAAGQCDCIYFNNTFLVDFPVVGALIAPRPLLICSGRKDGDFPPDGYHEVYRRSKRIFDLHDGKDSERIKEVDDDCGHSDIPLFFKEARQWMHRWLKGDRAPVEIEPPPKQPREKAEDLAVLDALPADAVNYRIQDVFVGPSARPQDLAKEIGDKVFRWFPVEKIPFETRMGRDTGGWAARYAEYTDATFDTERGVPVRVRVLKPRNLSKDTPLLLYVKRAGDSIYFLDHDELLPLLGRVTVVILTPRFTENPLTPREYADLERSASWVGRTIASMQVWDILRAVEWIVADQRIPASSITAFGKQGMGALAIYAGLKDPRIGRVVLQQPPASHVDGPALLNILRITDLPEVARTFGTRKLIAVGKAPANWEGCAEAGSLPEALEVWKY